MASIRTRHGDRFRASRRAVSQLWARRNMNPQQRANVYALSTAPAVITASLGGGDSRRAW
ncbi:hypothetical protein H7J07_15520 [Mycobacterium koreense]|uniref:hypothetical protein n=1 Tax=Mycolicibacillus koreensis TaxID=1069220 RepID=UPI000AA8D9DF|nr:hypothetical protein [Mycolicibacillus koreensis]MCV7249616.1 hypothetical protein [Mycolicibacillus koreensis]BBY56055.1 hypothetical protein MKOR_33060 [Mycolicibacillus koreensis]